MKYSKDIPLKIPFTSICFVNHVNFLPIPKFESNVVLSSNVVEFVGWVQRDQMK